MLRRDDGAAVSQPELYTRAVVSCARCGAESPGGARFCVSCGTSLVPACQHCGSELPRGARFCPSCGASVVEAEPAPPGQERKLVTILFADVSGSTALGERLDAERVAEVMNAFFAAMRAEIEAEGGTVEKYIGDAVMAVFGVPVAHEDDPSRALRAALRMQRRLAEEGSRLRPSHGAGLRIRVGVNTGEVLAAIQPKPGEAMVAGDPVNVAARLEQGAAPGQIVASERTARAARGFRFRELGRLGLRGRAESVPAVLVLGEQALAEHGLPGLRAPMVGRGRELALLQTVFERAAADGRPHLVTVYGDPGVGKSRLVAEFLAWVDGLDEPAVVVRGRCLPYGEGITYWPLAEILKARSGVHDTDPPAVALERIRTMGESLFRSGLAPDAARTAAALAYTVGLEDPDVPLRELSPRQVHAETHAAWRSFFSALASRDPLVAVVEDIHWADTALLDLLEGIAERADGPIVLVCPARPDLTERHPGWGGGRGNSSSIVLEPLPLSDADRLVRLLLSVEDVPARTHARILERAEGNPFFLEEILRQLIDEGRIVHEEGSWRWAAAGDDVAIPDTVQGVLAARIDLLDRNEKQTLQRAAVVGRVFWPGPLSNLLDSTGEALASALDQLEERDLILPRPTSAMAGQAEYAFKHALVRDIAYESMPRRDRLIAHANVASWIEETAGERKLEFVELLAHHYLEAYLGSQDYATDGRAAEEHRSRAFEHFVLASAEARSKLALAKAASHAEQAVELASNDLERSRALEALGEAFHADYRGDDAWRALRGAADARLAGAPERRQEVAYLCARAIELPTRWPGVMRDLPSRDVVRRYLGIGLEHLRDGDSTERVRLLTAQSMFPFAFFYEDASGEELEAARRAGEEAAEMALRLDEPVLASAALDGVMGVHMVAGLYGPMSEVSRRRRALVSRLSDPAELGDLHAAAAWTSFTIGRYREALEVADHGIELSLAAAPSWGMHCLVWRVMALFRLGEWNAAIEAHERLEATLGERWNDPPRPYLRAAAARALIHEARGERAASDRQLAVLRAIEDVQRTRSVTGPPWVALTLARRGSFAEARDWLDRLRWREGLGLRLEAQCVLIAEQGSWAEAPQVVREAREHAAQAGLLALPCYADRLEGQAALHAGDVEQAARSLTAASEGFARLEARWEQACSDLSLGEALLCDRRPEEAGRRLRWAAAVFEEVGSLRELAHARELLG